MVLGGFIYLAVSQKLDGWHSRETRKGTLAAGRGMHMGTFVTLCLYAPVVVVVVVLSLRKARRATEAKVQLLDTGLCFVPWKVSFSRIFSSAFW